MKMDNIVEQITGTLQWNGFDVHVVGGAVRDQLNGVEAHDIDLVTNATPQEMIPILTENHQVNFVGASFGVLIVDGIEVATYRADVHNGIGDENCIVEYVDTLLEDLSRRDLTINAMALPLPYGDVVDPFNGQDDLENGLIRFVGNADERINEDPNRILRACRFLAKIDGDFAPETFEALRRNAHLVRTHVAPERIKDEILKAMETERPSSFFAALETIGVLAHILPELSRSWNHDHGNHHLETVFDHMMIAGDHASPKDPVLRLACFLHDYGKPEAFVRNADDPKKNFKHHDAVGADLLRRDLPLLRFSNDDVDRIAGVTRCHMYKLSDLTPRAWRRMLKNFHDREVHWRDFVRVRMSDRFANLNYDPFVLSDWKGWVAVLLNGVHEETPFNTHALAVSGGQLISELGLRPGPVVSELQNFLLEFVLDEGAEFNTTDALLEQAQGFLLERQHNEEVADGRG